MLLTEKTLACPDGKEVCLILVRDMTELLFKVLQKQPIDLGAYQNMVFNCSGCRGLIKFALLAGEEQQLLDAQDKTTASLTIPPSKADPRWLAAPLVGLLSEKEKDVLLSQMHEVVVDDGAVVIRKGEKNCNIYLLLEGELAVEDVGIRLATLTRGDICGEMSYLGADVAVSTVLATKASILRAVTGEVFGRLLGQNPAVQTYMAQLLALRLRQTNEARTRDFASCMTGRVEEVVPAELFQIFHMHQKTGVLTLEVPGKIGKVSFRQGCIINAELGELKNEEAIFKILAEKTGVYRFTTGLSPQEMRAAEIGDFMMLLMEGVKRVDEEQSR